MDVPSKATNPATGSKEVKTLHFFYFSYLWNRIAGSFPCFPGSNFVGRISNMYFVTTRARPRKRRTCLPLPLPSKILDSFQGTKEASRFLTVLDDIMGNLFLNLHNIQKNLQFWQSKVEGSNVRKMYFILFERGPWAFVDETIKLIRDCLVEGSSIQNLRHHATAYISDRITILTKLRHSLATFLAQVYMEVDQSGEKLITDPEQALIKLLVTMNLLFLKLEASIGDLLATCESSFSVGNCSTPLRFEKLLEGNQEGSQWTDAGIRDAICLTYENLQRLDSFLSVLVAKIQKPRKVTLYWTRYTCVAIGFSICSFWLLRHSRIAGSSDIDNWIHEAKDSTIHFWNDHVEQPFFSIRDELFETFRKRHKGVMEIEEVQLTANSLHRMLLAFSKQTTGQDLPENTSDQEMLEIVMSRYEKELTHPIQNLLNGELARSLLIQVQKLKLDIETAMLELNQILRANEINFAILAALPAFFLSLLLLIVVRAWFKQDTRAEGKGRIARLQRRLLVVEVEKRIMQYQTCMDEGLEEDAQSAYGLTLYTLDRLCRAVERHAKATGEWLCLRQDIVDLGKPGLQTSYKLIITSRMERVYDCLLPALTRQ